MHFMFRPLAAYADFQGRARRAEYWQWTLLNTIVLLAIAVAGYLVPVMAAPLTLARLMWSLGTFIPGLAVTVRRFHDINRTGWWTLYIVLVPAVFMIGIFIVEDFLLSSSPLAGFSGYTLPLPASDYVLPAVEAIVGCALALPMLLMTIKDGAPKANSFGPDPKGRGKQASAF